MAAATVPAVNNIDALYDPAVAGPSIVVSVILYVLIAIALWKIFTKAGYPGVLAIIPVVNVVFLVKIAGFSGWLALLYLIPVVNVIFTIVVAIRLGRNFDKGAVFSIFLLWLLPIIGYFILGYGSAEYDKRT